MDFSLTEAERDLVALCREVAQREIAVRAPQAWDDAVCPTDLPREMGALGLLGMLVPERWGGIGMSTVGFVAAMEQLGLADQSVAAAWQAHVTIGSVPLLLFGDDAQRERWLRPLAEGRALGAFGLTEPDAGSDARGIQTRAVHQDGGWLINGRKTFISNAARHPLGLGAADDLLGAYSYLAGNDSRWTTGSAIVVDGGYAAP
jgi:short/branched chain acyl-CoA dehydrogenase